MHSALSAAFITFAATVLLAAGVALRRRRVVLHWLVLGLLAAIAIWSGGAVARFAAQTREGVDAALEVMWLGVVLTPPAWLLLACRTARVRSLEERPLLGLGLLLPSALVYAGVLTNDAHQLFATQDLPVGHSAGGPLVWGGPLFWVFFAWAYACIGGGVGLYLDSARRMVAGAARAQGLLLGLAALVPLGLNLAYVSGAVRMAYDPTPSALALSVLVLVTGVLRDRLFEALPLARRDVIERLHEGVLIVDDAGLVRDLNPAAANMLGVDAAQVCDHPLARALAGLMGEGDATALDRALGGLDPDAPPRVIECENEAGCRVEISAMGTRAGNGMPKGRFFVLRDRTEERRYERFVRQSQKLESVGQLAAGIAHEVNNPLAFVRSNLNHLEHLVGIVKRRLDVFDSEEARELEEFGPIVEEALVGIERIGNIVGGLRRFSRMQGEERTELDPNDVVQEAIKLAELHRNRAVAVEANLGEGLPLILGSRERLLQVLLNLLINAKQALGGRSDGRIVVETGRDGAYVEISVRDNGCGVPDEIRERIFDAFFTTKSPEEGTGLGLAIAFDIVRDHGGVLDLVSRPGAGTCFTARLPVPVPEPGA